MSAAGATPAAQGERGALDGIVVVDESGVRRGGDKSVGIARQYLGSVGKVENGQVGVYLTYASEHG